MRPRYYVLAAAAGAIIGAGTAYHMDTPSPSATYTQTITCQRVHIDDIAPEAIEVIDRLRWSYPAERIVIDHADGSVRALPVAMVPSPCNPEIQEDEVLIIE